MKASWLLCAVGLSLGTLLCPSNAEMAKLQYDKVVDLSHEIVENQMPADPSLTQPSMKFFSRVGQKSDYNLETISYCPHTGTHMDAPFHIDNTKHAIEGWKADVLMGPAVIIKTGHPGAYVISKEDIITWEKKNGKIKPGDAVLFHTGHDANWSKGYDAYIKNGYTTVSPEAAEYLVSKKVRFVGTESISPDGPAPNSHKVLLSHEIPVLENVCNLESIKGTRCYTVGTFANVKGGTGVWVRLLALQ